MGKFLDSGHIIMCFEDWVALPNHPRQRPTDKHAKQTAKSIHAEDYGTHRKVCAVRIGPTGTLYKADGHTRTYHWTQGSLTPPETVQCDIYEAEDEEDFDQLYYSFDSTKSTKSASDDLFGMFNDLGLEFKTPRLRAGGVKTALNEAWGGPHDTKATFKLIQEWRDELLLTDALYDDGADPPRGLKSKGHPNALVAAMLLSFRRYGAEVSPFWSDVTADVGGKNGRVMDCVEAANRLLREKKNSGGGGAAAKELMERLLSTVVQWRKGGEYTHLPKATSSSSFRQAAEKAKARRKPSPQLSFV